MSMNVSPKQYLVQKGVVKGYVYYYIIYLILKRYQLSFIGIHRWDKTILKYIRLTITKCKLVVTTIQRRRGMKGHSDFKLVCNILFPKLCGG